MRMRMVDRILAPAQTATRYQLLAPVVQVARRASTPVDQRLVAEGFRPGCGSNGEVRELSENIELEQEPRPQHTRSSSTGWCP